jgi:integrase/recombinase XerD
MSNATTAVLVVSGDERNLRILLAGFYASYGASTRKNYMFVMGGWLRWCEDHGLSLLDVDRPHIDLWARWLEEERGLAPSSVMHYLCVLRSFYAYLEEEGAIASPQARRVRLPRVSQESTTKGLTRTELSRSLAISERNPPPTQCAACWPSTDCGSPKHAGPWLSTSVWSAGTAPSTASARGASVRRCRCRRRRPGRWTQRSGSGRQARS